MVALAAAALLLAVAALARTVWRLRVAPDDRRVARYIEERCPALQDRLTSAADVARGGRPSPFRDLVVGDAARHARDVDARLVVPRSEIRRRSAQVGAAVAGLLLVLAAGSDPLGRLGRTAWLYAFPHTAALHVEPGDARVPVGDPLRLHATLDAGSGAPARTPPVVVMTDGEGGEQIAGMEAVPGGAYHLEIPAVEDSFSYRVRAAALESGPYAVTALHAPRVERIDVAYRYPPSIGLPPRIEIDGGDVQAPPGTRVTVTVRMSKPVEQAVLARAEGGRTALAPAGDPAVLAGTFEVGDDDTYRIRARDADGLRNPAGVDYFIRSIADEPPAVEIVRPGGDREITPLEEVVVEARAEDDYGLRGFELVYGLPGRTERVVSLQHDDGAARTTGRHTIFAEDLPLEPGNFITYHVRARDTGAAVTRSDIYFLEVRPFGREFEEARSQDSTGMPADELGRLQELQKEIVVATWKIDGRRPAERSPEDIETVADAQNDVALATRVLASRLSPPAPVVDAGGSDETRAVEAALAAAVESMTAAETGLRAGRTDAAIPHEMAALEHLRQARDEAARTQVQPPTNRSAPGSGPTAQEDLSALFDRELRREQETNYENRRQEPEPSADEGDDALRRRLQELARRQEDLNRRQQALAEEADEADRQAAERLLERLAREQEEIQQEMEALGRELVQPGREAAGRPPAARAAREAAEQMRRAAEQLGRGDPSQAAERGRQALAGAGAPRPPPPPRGRGGPPRGRGPRPPAPARGRQALAGLRELGRRLGEGAPRADGRGRVGDLQLEAQQLAGLQRQLGEEAARARQTDDAGQTSGRLAARQDRLADRVEALAERMGQARQGAADGEREALERAEGVLAEEDAARGMREVAEQLRRAGAAGEGAGGTRPGEEASAEDAADRIAAALERVAGELAGAGDVPGSDRGRLAAELEAAQELRRRLEEIGERPRGGAERSEPGGRDAAAPSAAGAGIDGVLEALARARPDLGPDLEQWARHWWSGSAPGTDPELQDLSAWTSLYSELQVLLDEFEVARTRELGREGGDERPGLGPDDGAPAPYRRMVDEYYRSLAEQP
ncbi:MAG: hypothetical protein F4057_07960 [Acidobacteria bacterium]|nr:hypothetical protein [Acidobacteriota bacterium]